MAYGTRTVLPSETVPTTTPEVSPSTDPAAGLLVSGVTVRSTDALRPAGILTWRAESSASPVLAAAGSAASLTVTDLAPELRSTTVLVRAGLPPMSASPRETASGEAVTRWSTAAATSSLPAPWADGDTSASSDSSGCALPMRVARSCSAVCSGRACASRAAAPATCGAAIDVPDIRYRSPSTPNMAGMSDMISKPGATISGLSVMASLGPRELKSVVVSVRSTEPMVPRAVPAATSALKVWYCAEGMFIMTSDSRRRSNPPPARMFADPCGPAPPSSPAGSVGLGV